MEINKNVARDDWFSGWFDSSYYHILYKDRDYKEAERFLSNLTDYLALPKGSKLLDLACGKGRHSIYLNTLGYNVTGLDLASNSIQEASKVGSDSLRFATHDMRLPIPNAPYDAIFNVFTSFGYFNNPEEDLKTLKNVVEALADKGTFVFDFLNVDFVEANLVKKETKTVEGICFHLTRRIEQGSIYKEIVFSEEGKDYRFQERVDALRYADLKKYFAEVGLTIITQFGDYDLNPFDINTSKRLILISQKS